MNHDMTLESPESGVLMVSTLRLPGHFILLTVAHTVAINVGDTITFPSKYFAGRYVAEVKETEWWTYEGNETYICHCLVQLIP